MSGIVRRSGAELAIPPDALVGPWKDLQAIVPQLSTLVGGVDVRAFAVNARIPIEDLVEGVKPEDTASGIARGVLLYAQARHRLAADPRYGAWCRAVHQDGYKRLFGDKPIDQHQLPISRQGGDGLVYLGGLPDFLGDPRVSDHLEFLSQVRKTGQIAVAGARFDVLLGPPIEVVALYPDIGVRIAPIQADTDSDGLAPDLWMLSVRAFPRTPDYLPPDSSVRMNVLEHGS